MGHVRDRVHVKCNNIRVKPPEPILSLPIKDATPCIIFIHHLQD